MGRMKEFYMDAMEQLCTEAEENGTPMPSEEEVLARAEQLIQDAIAAIEARNDAKKEK